MAIPILGRLAFWDYVRLAYAIGILVLDRVLRVLWYFVPIGLLDLLLRFLHIKPWFQGKRAATDGFLRLRDTVDLVRHFGLDVEEHVVFTDDGHMLMLHRIVDREGGDGKRDARHSARRIPVLMLHGTMLASEIWLVHREREKNLPFALHDTKLYDVWLGNRRGNKYSNKHVVFRPGQPEFWDWSIDETALYDLPRMVEHVLEVTGCGSLVLIGFSQGTAEIFAGLSLNARLAKRVSLVIALAAMTRPQPVSNSLISALIHSTPDLLFLFFGRRMLLSSVFFWQDVMSAEAYSKLIDFFLSLLFGWSMSKIKPQDRPAMYLRMYSYCSVKTIAHWFQMMRVGRFQMFDDEGNELGIVAGRRTNSAPAFPLRQLATPTVLFHGAQDTLSDKNFTMKELQHATVAEYTISDYEHLDFLMAHDVDTVVIPKIMKHLSLVKRVEKTGSGVSSSGIKTPKKSPR